MTKSGEQATGVVDPRQLMDTAAQAAERGQAFLQNVQAMNTELVRFWIGRLDQDWMLAGELAKCRSIEEILPVQQRFAQEMVRAYAALAPRLLGAVGPMLVETTGQVRAAHDQAA